MDFLGKDKLARLDEERQQRRKARADEAVKRLDEVGKKTQQMVVAHVQNGGEPNAKPGGLSRVLFEHATGADEQKDGRRSSRRNKRQDHAGIQAEGRRALGTIDHAMSHIQGAMVDATGAGLRNGLEGAARSVSDAVQRVSTLANGVDGQHAASNNPLAELMAEEAAEQQEDQKTDQRHDNGHDRGHLINDALGGNGGLHNLAAGAFDANTHAITLEHGVAATLGHETAHVVQQGADALNVPRQLGQSLVAGLPEDRKDNTAANVTANLLSAPPREAAHNALNAPREALERAADGPRQIAENLRDAPAHAIDNVTQVAGHVARNHSEGLGALGALVDASRDPASALAGAGNAIRDVAGQAAKTALPAVQNVVGSVDQARESLDPTKLASQAANTFSSRNIVEQAANLGGVRDVATNIDPRAVAERTTSVVDPRNLLRSSVDPTRALEGKTNTPAGPNTNTPNAPNAPAAPKTPATNAPAAHRNGPEHAHDPSANPAANAHAHAAPAATPADVHAAKTQATPAVSTPAYATAGGHSGAIAQPAPAHSSAVVTGRGNPTGAAPTPAPPAPSPTSLAHSALPASERQTPASHIQPSRDRTTSDVAANGQATITPQPVVDVAPPVIDRKQNPIQQPSFTIEMRDESGALPALPPAPAPPQINQPPVSTPAPPAVANTPTTSARAVAPLPPAPPTAATPPNPAIAAGHNAIAAITVPQGTVTPLPPSNTSVAPAAPPTPAGPAHPGPGAMKTTAQATQTPIAAPVPSSALAATPSAPKTPTPATAAPVVPAVRHPGGDNVPDPASIVQSNVSLTPDRTASAQAIGAEAQSQSNVGPESLAQRNSLIAPLAPQMQAASKSADAPMANAGASSAAQGQQAAAAARAREAQEAATGRSQIGNQLQGAQAERAQFAAMPPPSILQQTSSAAMQPVAGAGQAAVQSAASAVGASPVQLDPAVVARSTAAGAVHSTLPPFDAARFQRIDQHAPVPAVNTASVDAAQEAAAQNYKLANQQIQNIQNIPPPIVNVPASANAAKLTSGGQPTREAAIARIEQEVAQQTNAQAPAQMRNAAAGVQSQLTNHVTTSEATARAQAASQVGAAQSQAAEIGGKAPPITGAQAAAQAQPEYLNHQNAATLAHQQMQAQIAGAHGAADASAQAARGVRDQTIQTAQTNYQSEVAGQVMPQYAAQQQTANAEFHASNETAQQAMATEQTQANVEAQAKSDEAKAKADADIASHQAQLDQQRQSAITSHLQQAQHATQQHEASMQQQQSQMDAQVNQHQSEMHSQVAAAQAQGQREVDQHLSDGESGYRTQIQQGEQQANAEKQKAEREATAKQAQADEEKKKHSGGLFGGIIGWVKDRVNDLMNAVKSVLSAARDMVVSLMEKARQAAMAVLEKARQAAIAAMQKAKSAIQGVISACASAIRSVITAVANQIKGLIQSLANVLKGLVSALTTLLSSLVAAYQAAMNAVMNGLIAAVSFANKDLGDKLRTSTQKYRDSFNTAMNGLKSNIDAAGQALQAGIQRSADGALAVVDSAEKTLDDSVTRAEQTMNASVETAYHAGVTAINASFDAAELVVNKSFDVAESGVKAYFDLQIGAISVVQKGIDAVADFAIEVADQVMTAIDKIAQAVVSLIPDSWKKAFVNFWNGPWRSVIIIGLATIAAVAITAATLGTGAPVAAILLASVIGGTIAGTAYFGGEMVSRESDISLSTQGKGMYVAGFGDIQIGKDGKPIPPPGLTPEKQDEFDKQAATSMSNFNLQQDQNGQVTGYDRKSGSEITNYATQEGIKGFAEGAISSGLAVAGGTLGGAAVKGLGLAAESTMGSVVSTGVSNVIIGPIQSTMTGAFDAGFEAMKAGKSPVEAFKAGLAAGGKAIKDPGSWAAAMLTMGVAPLKLNFITKPLENALGGSASKIESELAKTAIKKGVDVVTESMTQTMGSVGGAYISAYSDAKAKGLTDAQARAEASKAANAAFTPEAIATTLAMNTAGTLTQPHENHERMPPHPAEDVHATPPATDTAPHPNEKVAHPTDNAPSTTRTSSDPHTPLSDPNPATAHSSNAPIPTQTEPNIAVQHSTTEPKPVEHPNEVGSSTTRTTSDRPASELREPPRTTNAADKVAPSDHQIEAKSQVDTVATHELPPSRPISELEPRLDAIAINADGEPASAVAAVREARAEIHKLKTQKLNAENGTGKWAHATPEQRAAQVKLIEDRINQTAQDAVDKYDRSALSPTDDATALKKIEGRTPEQIQMRKQEIEAARASSAKRDLELTNQIASKTEKIGDANHVKQVFDHITMGAGFAGVANETSRPNRGPNDIVIGGANPWDGAKSALGQKVGDSNVPNAAPGHQMHETVSDPASRFMLASEHADNVALNKNDAGLRTYDGKSGALEPGPKADWPDWATAGGATVRTEVTGADGTKRYFYSKQVDVAVGPGPARMLSEAQLDPATLKRMKAAGAFAVGDQGFDPGKIKSGDVAVYGPAAAGAWGVEASAAHTTPEGTKNNVEWMGRAATPSENWPPELRAQYDKIQADLRTAHESGDPAAIHAAEKANTDFLFEKAPGNGNLPRNQQPGGAFDENLSADNGGNVTRRIGEIEKVTYEPDPKTGKDRVKITLTDKGPDGKPVVVWKDSLVLTIGQDATGKGGPVELIQNYKGKLEPIYGPPQEPDGFRPVVGVKSEDGSIRVLGAAATPRDVSSMLDQKKMSADEHQQNLRNQAEGLNADSKGVIPGFVLAEKDIKAANTTRADEMNARTNQQLAELITESPATQRAQNAQKPNGIIRTADGPIDATPVSDLSLQQRTAAREKYGAVITQLEGGEHVPMPTGQASVEMMSSITAATGKEVALLRSPTGERYMVLGNENSVDLPPGTKVIAHSHPGGNLQFSHEDESALAANGQKSSVLVGADGSVGRFRTSDKEVPASMREDDKALHEPDKMVELKDPERYAKFIPNADPLHKAISEQQRYDVIKDFPVKLITSAPGHQNLRSPEAMVAMSQEMNKLGTGSIFEGKEPIQLNVFTDTVNGKVIVKSIEVQDGNHRLAAGLYANKWNSIKDIPPGYLDIEVNGFDTQGKQHPRWIPLAVAQSSSIPKDQWQEVPKEWGAKGPTAQVSGGVSSQDATIPEKFRGVTLDKVIARSLERVSTEPAAPANAPANAPGIEAQNKPPVQTNAPHADEMKTPADGAAGTGGKFGASDKEVPAAARENQSLHEPDRIVELKDPERYAKFIPNADPLHKSISEQQRYDVIKDFPVKMITSAPGHQNLRSPEAMVAMSQQMNKLGTGNIFEGKEPIQLNVFTDTVNGKVIVKSIEVQDGNHRLAAGLYANKWNSIKDIPPGYLDIEVNGFDTQGKQHPRWIPLAVAQSSSIPKDQWQEVPKEWGAKGPTAQVSGGVSSQDATIPEKFRGVTLDKVIARSLERVATDGATPAPGTAPVAPGTAPAVATAPGTTGAETPTGPPVQRKASTERSDLGTAHPTEVARRGTQGAGGTLPHLEQIQRSFGRHDVSGVRAHVGGEAAESSRALGAQAFAHGDAVAFAGSPDLHTAAHEAAHVVQQRGGVQLQGGIDGGGADPYERNADAVADAVVAGRSAEALLGQSSTGAGGAVVQRVPAPYAVPQDPNIVKVGNDRGALDSAEKNLQQLDQDLATELAGMGAGFTAAQSAEYIHKFQATKQYQDARRAIGQDEATLGSELAGSAGKVVKHDANGNGSNQGAAAQTLIDSYRAMASANKDGARAAMVWAHGALGDSKLASHRTDITAIQQTAQNTFSTTLLAQLQQMIVGGDKPHLPQRIVAAVFKAHDELENVASVIKLGTVPGLLQQFASELKMGKQKAEEARALAAKVEGADPAIKRLATGLFAFVGVAETTASFGKNELDAITVLHDDGAALLDAIKGAKSVDQIQAQLSRFAGGAKAASTVFAVLGIASSAIATEQDFKALLKSQSLSHIAMFVGAFMSTVGGVLEVMPPPLDVAGLALSVIGTGLNAIVGMFDSGPSQEQKDERVVLPEMGFTPPQVAAFSGGSSPQNLKQAQQAGLTPQQIQKIANMAPNALSMITQLQNVFHWLRQPSQGRLKEANFGTFVEEFISRGALSQLGMGFGQLPILGPSLQFGNASRLPVLQMLWNLLGHGAFAEKPSEQWGLSNADLGLTS